MAAVADTVLVVDHEPAVRQVLRTALADHGLSVREAGTIAEAERVIAARVPVAMLLDLGLPDGDSLDLLRRIRSWSLMPVLILSSRTRERDKVRGLNAGADDYITKPFGLAELLARVRVALRRTGPHRPETDHPVVEFGPLRIDRARGRVTRAGEQVHLTPIELKLLVLLARHPGTAVSYEQMMDAVAHAHGKSNYHRLRVHVAALRRKLELDPAVPEWILTEPSIGYRLRDPQSR